jgi:Ca2+-binding RTX toxin-like protein
MTDDYFAIVAFGEGTRLQNAGFVQGIENAVTFGGDSSDLTTILVNSGTISASMTGLLSQGTEAVLLRNTGLIISDEDAYVGNVGADEIGNKGTIEGNIFLGGGANIYLGAAGHLLGSISGGADSDHITTGADDDRISGGFGKDFLTGGAGADTFVITGALDIRSNVDTITDFNAKLDTLELNHTVFDALSSGTVSSKAFVANATGLAADASDRIVYETDTGKVFYDHDGKGGDAAILFATLNGHPTVTHADFHVV